MKFLYRAASCAALVALFAFLSSSRPVSGPTAHSPAAFVPPDCFSGKWGNDFSICGSEYSGKAGKGNKRQAEELTLQFKGKDKGELNFYDCRNGKRATQSIPFTYELANNVIRFYWEGTPREIDTYDTYFRHRDTFRYDCQGDTLRFTDGLLDHTIYQGSAYFVRR